ncbi:hypothetical protein [Flagellimonas flava]|jgi:hypothetical protein|uniref:hypothetical protein n=1 Tax=Flagellimonas flava TaxID=570519 RepID=UPI003D6458F4
MIYITYKYHRDVFEKGGNFKPWVRKAFGDNVRFHGFGYGMYEPTIKIDSVSVFEEGKDRLKTKNIIQIAGTFNTIDQLALGVRNFVNYYEDGKLVKHV